MAVVDHLRRAVGAVDHAEHRLVDSGTCVRRAGYGERRPRRGACPRTHGLFALVGLEKIQRATATIDQDFTRDSRYGAKRDGGGIVPWGRGRGRGGCWGGASGPCRAGGTTAAGSSEQADSCGANDSDKQTSHL